MKFKHRCPNLDPEPQHRERVQPHTPNLPLEVEVHFVDACEDHGDVDLHRRRGVGSVAAGKQEPANGRSKTK